MVTYWKLETKYSTTTGAGDYGTILTGADDSTAAGANAKHIFKLAAERLNREAGAQDKTDLCILFEAMKESGCSDPTTLDDIVVHMSALTYVDPEIGAALTHQAPGSFATDENSALDRKGNKQWRYVNS